MSEKSENITDALEAERVEIELGRRLKRRRIELGLKQSELAERAGVVTSTISLAENGAGSSMGTFISLLRALGALSDLNAILPDPGPSPIALTRSRKRSGERQRVSKAKEEVKAAEGWQWGDGR